MCWWAASARRRPAAAQVQVNHLSVGKISGGATVERAVANNLGEGNQIRWN
jgi:flagellar basal body P-ring protein FlgI